MNSEVSLQWVFEGQVISIEGVKFILKNSGIPGGRVDFIVCSIEKKAQEEGESSLVILSGSDEITVKCQEVKA